MTVGWVIANVLAVNGVRRVFGIPGGGSGPLLKGLSDTGIEFVLCRSETSAAIMAAVESDRSGTVGVVLTSLGPGSAASINGACAAQLERSALIVLTERLPSSVDVPGAHQRIDQFALFLGAAKDSFTIDAIDPARILVGAIRLAQRRPSGTVHVDLPSDVCSTLAPSEASYSLPQEPDLPNGQLTLELQNLIQRARLPILWCGLDSRGVEPARIERVATNLRIPVLTTYKAKGVLNEFGEWSAGVSVGELAKRDILCRSDLIITLGLDPIELLSPKNRIGSPVLQLAPRSYPNLVFSQSPRLVLGDLNLILDQFPTDGQSVWRPEDVEEHRRSMTERLGTTRGPGPGLDPWEVGQLISKYSTKFCHVTIDAGAHMVPLCELWRSAAPGRFWISNGLSTMGYALPAAVALARANRTEAVLGVTGDGGLLMVLGELATAQGLDRLTLIVFDDGHLSLIHAKQVGAEKGLGVIFKSPNWPALAESLGWTGVRVTDTSSLAAALDSCPAACLPTLIAVEIDPSSYSGMLKALRG